MSGLIEGHGDLIAVVSLCLVAAVLVAVVFLLREIRRLKQPFRAMAEVYERKGVERALSELLKGVDENREFIRGHSEEIKKIADMLEGCYSGIGLVKYNAFEDVGGQQSFSLCMLTGRRNGFIITSLVGRNATRSYALDVDSGKPSRELSEEEKEAFAYADRSIQA